MSVEQIARALNLRDDRLTPVDRLVLIGIANHDGDGGAWPSLATLARYAGNANRRTVQRSLRRLEAAGYLVVDRQAGGTHATPDDRRPNLYLIRWPMPEDRTGPIEVDDPDDDDRGGPTTAPQVVHRGGPTTAPRGGPRAAPLPDRGGPTTAPGAVHAPPEPSSNRPRENLYETHRDAREAADEDRAVIDEGLPEDAYDDTGHRVRKGPHGSLTREARRELLRKGRETGRRQAEADREAYKAARSLQTRLDLDDEVDRHVATAVAELAEDVEQ